MKPTNHMVIINVVGHSKPLVDSWDEGPNRKIRYYVRHDQYGAPGDRKIDYMPHTWEVA